MSGEPKRKAAPVRELVGAVCIYNLPQHEKGESRLGRGKTVMGNEGKGRERQKGQGGGG